MTWFAYLLVVLLFITSAILTLLILLHRGKGGGLSSMFGGGVSSSLAGSSVAEKNLDRYTVLVGVIWFACIVGFVCGGVIPGILGLLGYLKADTEPQTAQKFTKWAWIVFAIIWALNILWIVIAIATGVFSASMSTY